MNNKSVNKSSFTKIWKFISSPIFSNREYTYHDAFNSKVHNNYDITDATELRLISSRRTFL